MPEISCETPYCGEKTIRIKLSDALIAEAAPLPVEFRHSPHQLVKKENTSVAVSIYPNPAEGAVFIRQTDKSPVEVMVFTMKGVLVLQLALETTTGRLDTGNLPPGCYFLEIRDLRGEQAVSVHRLFITR